MIRSKIVSLAVVLMFLLLGFGILNLGIIQGRKFRDLSKKNCIRLLPQGGARGRILDRYGNIIVDSKLSYDVMILPQEISQLDKTLTNISKVLAVSSKDLKNVANKGYIAPFVPINVASNIDLKKAIALEELKSDSPSIIIQPVPLRSYPYGRLSAHLIGYVSEIDRWRLTKLADYGYKTKDIVGFGGVEEKYDYYLREEEGGLSVEVDHLGRLVRVLGFRPARNGRDIQLTIDLKIQKIVDENLANRKGAVIVMDPYTGEILAMSSSPSFNPKVFVDKTSSSIANLVSDSSSPFLNRAISSAYPAGSVFKIVVATAALETKKINSSTTFNCPGKLIIGKQEFSCWNTHSDQNLVSAIAHSCNVFFYRTGLLVGAQNIHDYASKLGFSRPTYFELPYETGGFVPSPLWRKIHKFKNWFDGDTANLSIGQGEVLVTPLQITRMMAVFANGGFLVTPYVVKVIEGKDISGYQRRIANLNLKNTTIEYIRRGLKEVVSDPGGTANVLSSLKVSVAGKTGTAQAPPGQAHAWFVGYFPFKNPKYVICVFLEHGGPGYYSSVLAKQIIEQMVSEGII